MTTLPLGGLGGGLRFPLLAFVGVLLTRRSARELESRSKREEVMRNLRWAAELAVSEDSRQAELGVAHLLALTESDLLDESQQLCVDAALQSVVRQPAEVIDGSEIRARDEELEARSA